MSEELGRSPSMDIEEANYGTESPQPAERVSAEQPPNTGLELVPQEPQQSRDSQARKIVDEVVYGVKEDPEYTKTRALFVGNLTTPFDNQSFQRMISDAAEKAEAKIERAWLNARRSHCIVIVSTIEGAEAVRAELNGLWFPLTEGNATPQSEGEDEFTGQALKRQRLYIDYIPVKATQLWIDQENHGPRDAVWKVSYTTKIGTKSGKPFLVAAHQMVNYPNRSDGYKTTTRRDSGYRRADYRSRDDRDRYRSREGDYYRRDERYRSGGGSRYRERGRRGVPPPRRERSRSPVYSRSRSPRGRSPRWSNE